jgi:methionyl-tRNA formyltransferase
VTIMRMVPKLDAGPIVHQVRTPIADDETAGELQLRLSELGALALIEALALLDAGAATETIQDESAATYAPKITRESARIDWSMDAADIARAIRAYDPRPGAHTALNGTEVKMFGPTVFPVGGSVGVVLDCKGHLRIGCGRGSVAVTEVQPAGKRRMQATDWANGRGIGVGDKLGG